jgi:hypothetical protein
MISAYVATYRFAGAEATRADGRIVERHGVVSAGARIPLTVPTAVKARAQIPCVMRCVPQTAKPGNWEPAAVACVPQTTVADRSSATEAASASNMVAMTSTGGRRGSAFVSAGQTAREAADGQHHGNAD